ncbi:MAG: GNAT family N-acetyltransferase [Bacillota bacterium]|nr:GNAT family N-acetyltransferase [Bacillota bacterium]
MMEIYLADKNDYPIVKHIVYQTIATIYPNYYPEGVVNYFLQHHNSKHIRQALAQGEVYLLKFQNQWVATGSIKDNEIGRLFVLPEFQHMGCGTRLMEELEAIIFAQHDVITLASSFPAYSMYIKRGYHPVSYHQIVTENGHTLCYHQMEKQIQSGND